MAASPSALPSATQRQSFTPRKVTVLAAVVLLLIFLGCMSIAIGNRTHDGVVLQDGTLVQDGETEVPAGAEQDIYYPIPYLHPPNLEVTNPFDHCVIVEQKEDHFRVKNNDSNFSREATWKARGVRAPVPVVVTTPEPTPVAPPPTPVTSR